MSVIGDRLGRRLASLSGERVFTDLFSLTDEAEIGHIRLARDADLVVVAPATADLIAKIGFGFYLLANVDAPEAESAPLNQSSQQYV